MNSRIQFGFQKRNVVLTVLYFEKKIVCLFVFVIYDHLKSWILEVPNDGENSTDFHLNFLIANSKKSTF